MSLEDGKNDVVEASDKRARPFSGPMKMTRVLRRNSEVLEARERHT